MTQNTEVFPADCVSAREKIFLELAAYYIYEYVVVSALC